VADTTRIAHEPIGLATDPEPHPEGRFSRLAAGLIGSEILKIAAEIRALKAGGGTVCDLTVGDFSPRQFAIPARLAERIREALARGETNYPPSNGLPELRQAVSAFYRRELRLDYPVESVLIASGSRPAIYAMYRAVCDAGDRVVYPVPSWNNNHYAFLVGATGVAVACGPDDRFLPRPEALLPHLRQARLLALNSPLNPTGGVLSADALRAIGEAVIEENASRKRRGERPLYVLYDQVYWTLCFGDAQHTTPPELLPELAPYSMLVDGISKAFAATGLRLGWAVGPPDLITRMATLLGHVGAWAPRAEQAATAAFLDEPEAVQEYRAGFTRGVEARLSRLHRGLQELKAQGSPVESLPPAGAIYLAASVQAFGRRTPAGAELKNSEDIRSYLLSAAGVGVVPFQAFGMPEDNGWFRLSVGAVGEAEIDAMLPRLAGALRSLG
jgi:aspartate aminotransferase